MHCGVARACVCVGVHVCAQVCLRVHTHDCRGQSDILHVAPQEPPTLLFEPGSLTGLGFSDYIVHLPMGPESLPVSASPALGLQACVIIPSHAHSYD